MKYMVLMQGPKGNWRQFNAMPVTDIKAHVAFMEELNRELTASGEFVDAQGLAFPDQAKIVTARSNAAPAVTDGPFPESKEFLAGYWIVDVENESRAVAIAAKVSTAPGRDGVPLNFPVEVRPVMSGPPVEP
jgi:hypothetical protein